MARTVSYSELGATLYTPCTHHRLAQVLQHGCAGSRSIALCMEDAVAERDIARAFDNLRQALAVLHPYPGLCRFLRPRCPMMLAEMLRMPGIAKIDGFALPKADLQTLPLFREALLNHAPRRFAVMPILETAALFDAAPLLAVRDELERWRDEVEHPIVCVRIGGNDLMSLLGLKRLRGRTIYETPLRQLMDNLVYLLRPRGFELSAPVFDFMEDHPTLARELETDIAYGLLAKTAIHPDQLEVIELRYRSFAREHQALASRVVEGEPPAVFRFDGQMIEPACHHNWAARTLALARATAGE